MDTTPKTVFKQIKKNKKTKTTSKQYALKLPPVKTEF